MQNNGSPSVNSLSSSTNSWQEEDGISEDSGSILSDPGTTPPGSDAEELTLDGRYRLAILMNDTGTLEEFLGEEEDFRQNFYAASNDFGEYPIHMAARSGCIENIYPDGVIEPEDINLREETIAGYTPIMLAANALKINMVELLIGQGARVDYVGHAPGNYTALISMIVGNSLTLSEIVGGGDPRGRLNPITNPQTKNDILAIAALLMQNGIDLNMHSLIEDIGQSLTATEIAARIGFAELVTLLNSPDLVAENSARRAFLGYPAAGLVAAGAIVAGPVVAAQVGASSVITAWSVSDSSDDEDYHGGRR